MARFNMYVENRYFELCDEHDDAVMAGNTMLAKKIDNELQDWFKTSCLNDEDEKPDIHETLEKCRNRIDFIDVLLDSPEIDDFGKSEIEQRLRNRQKFVKQFEAFLSDVMS